MVRSPGRDEREPARSPRSSHAQREEALEVVRDILRELRYGKVEIVVQDGFVLQVDRSDSFRPKHTQ